MADAPVIVAHGNKKNVKLWSCSLGKNTHILDKLTGFWASLVTESLVGDYLKFLGVDVKYHANRRVLWGRIPVVVALAVVALGLNVGLRMNMAAEIGVTTDGSPEFARSMS